MRAVAPTLRALALAILLFVLLDPLFNLTFPHFGRLRYNFSAAYVSREIDALRASRPVVVLGDSVLWGFGVDERETAVSLLRKRNPEWHNLAYAGGSPVNTLAMLRLLLHAGVHPKFVVFNVNEKQFNFEDSAYERLHPAIEDLAWASLKPAERASLRPVLATTGDARIDRALSRVWRFYGMRADLRDALFDETDAAHRLQDIAQSLSGASADLATAHRPTPDKFEGTYDLAPLARDNVAYDALQRIGALLRDARIPAVAVLTPTNHVLLHDYIDDPKYRKNLATVSASLHRYGVHVLDVDASFPAADFIDNDHLTAAGNARLARLILRAANT